MDEAEKKLAEEAAAAEAEGKAKAEAEAKAAEEALSKEIDYKALADAEKARADAAEALIVKNKAIAKRAEDKGEESQGLTEERVLELIKTATTKDVDDSPEAKAYAEAQAKVKELQAKNGEIARTLKAKEGVSKDTATTHFDGEKGTEPKLPENSPLKAFKYEGNGIYSQKLSSGKTMFKNVNPGPGQPKTWVV